MARLNKETTEQSAARPPYPKDEVMDCLHRLRRAKKLIAWPEGMPRDFGEAYDWFADYLLEPPVDSESPRRINTIGAGQRWECPYNRRMVSCVINYVLLSGMDQRFVMAAREDGVYWRGDPIDVFAKIVDETMRMREIGIDAYRTEAIAKMRKVIKQMAV